MPLDKLFVHLLNHEMHLEQLNNAIEITLPTTNLAIQKRMPKVFIPPILNSMEDPQIIVVMVAVEVVVLAIPPHIPLSRLLLIHFSRCLKPCHIATTC